MSFFKSASTIGGWTVLSRLMGFCREMLLANYLGAGLIVDALVISAVPSFVRRLAAEGTMNSFVPLFAGSIC